MTDLNPAPLKRQRVDENPIDDRAYAEHSAGLPHNGYMGTNTAAELTFERRTQVHIDDMPSLYTNMLGIQSRTVSQNEYLGLEAVVSSYFKHANNEQKAQIKSFLGNQLIHADHIPKEINLEIVLRFILEAETKALIDLADPDHFAQASLNYPADGDSIFYYQEQFGQTAEEQFSRICKMYNMLPSELLKRSNLMPYPYNKQFINMRWLNQAFIDTYKGIERLNTKSSVLVLMSKGLIAVPANIGRLTDLKLLYISDNQLTTLPPEIGNLKALEVLDIKRNKVTALPPEIENLTALKSLNLILNPLSDAEKDKIRAKFGEKALLDKTPKTQDTEQGIDCSII